jgi:hypothetical protein
MIVEGLVTTLNPDGTPHVAPMGPMIQGDMRAFVLRPYQTSTTYQNLKTWCEGVFHVTDDVLLLARAAIGVPPQAETRPAEVIRGVVLTGACRYYEFRVLDWDDQEVRATIHVATVAQGRLRDFLGFNRAKHAVVEAAILATRITILPLPEILTEFRRLTPLIEKTGGDAEREAFALLVRHVRDAAGHQGLDPDEIQR